MAATHPTSLLAWCLTLRRGRQQTRSYSNRVPRRLLSVTSPFAGCAKRLAEHSPTCLGRLGFRRSNAAARVHDPRPLLGRCLRHAASAGTFPPLASLCGTGGTRRGTLASAEAPSSKSRPACSTRGLRVKRSSGRDGVGEKPVSLAGEAAFSLSRRDRPHGFHRPPSETGARATCRHVGER